jgi:hypothetical protein
VERSGAAACRYEKAGSGAVSDSGRSSWDSGGAEQVAAAPAGIAQSTFTAEITGSAPLHGLHLSPSQEQVVLRNGLFHYLKISYVRKTRR